MPFTIKSVEMVGSGDDRIKLTSTEGEVIQFYVEGQCCDLSYFEDFCINDVKQLVGETLVNIEHVDSHLDWMVLDDVKTGNRHFSYHAVKITTNKSSITVDWRNESNGCYSGQFHLFNSEGRPMDPSEQTKKLGFVVKPFDN